MILITLGIIAALALAIFFVTAVIILITFIIDHR